VRRDHQTELIKRRYDSQTIWSSLLHKIFLSTPEVQGRTVKFRWHVEPVSSLYRQTHFTINFPSNIDLSRVPQRLWSDLLLICLHPHWLLLRPCEIHLPIKLGAPLIQFWQQLLQNGLDTLHAYGAPHDAAPLGITFVDGLLHVPQEIITGCGYGTAFSGGKDSLLQAGLLLELTERPLLVATTSPMPPSADHATARRRQVFDAIQERRSPIFVEARSNFRSIWDNSFAAKLGYRVAVNELTDTFLYTSCLLAVGAARGVTRLFIASETEVQENSLIDGKIVQHSHFMYSAATQRSLARLLAPYGLQFGSLIWPLHTMQVQQLLWKRYPDICDLQYSCWRVGEGQATCSQCEQCLRIAATALADGHDPQRMGIDLRKVIRFALAWRPVELSAQKLPQDEAAELLELRVVDAIRRIPLAHVRQVLNSSCNRSSALERLKNLKAMWNFRRLRRRIRRWPEPPSMGVREAFFDWLDGDLREDLIAIYTRDFPLEPRHHHLALFERSHALTSRAIASLDTPHENVDAVIQ
jgi:hypothetical protein